MCRRQGPRDEHRGFHCHAVVTDLGCGQTYPHNALRERPREALYFGYEAGFGKRFEDGVTIHFFFPCIYSTFMPTTYNFIYLTY